MKKKSKLFTAIAARILIGLVTFFNLQCAFYFLLRPGDYAPGFELSGVPGSAIVQGIGLLFVMWNVPYLFALINPFKFRISLIEVVIMQAVGVFGETILLLVLKGEHSLIKASVLRFIVFDGGGLILLAITLILVLRFTKTPQA